MPRTKRTFTTDFKKQVVAEYLKGSESAEAVAKRHGLEASHIYKFKMQLEAQGKQDRVEQLEAEGHNPTDVRRIMELEEELQAYKDQVAELTLINDLLKKLRHQPSSAHLKKSSGYIETKRSLGHWKKQLK